MVDSRALTNLDSRQAFTEDKWNELLHSVALEMGKHNEAGDLFERASAYVTGSMARDEAIDGSDLDLFVVDEVPMPDGSWARSLSRPEQAHFLSAIDNARRTAGFRPFSQSGRFVTTHSSKLVAEEIGNADDDFSNRFTARMLLLLNSRPLINPEGYGRLRDMVIGSYWRQQQDPSEPFMPVFLLNDIKRWWSVVLLNFEFNNRPVAKGDDSAEARQARAQRRVNNLKLRYARLLAAWTPILGILAESGERGVSRQSVVPVLDATPVGRLRTLASDYPEVNELLEMYNEYLEFMDCPKAHVYEKVLKSNWNSEIKERAYNFGDRVGETLKVIGAEKPLFRYILI